MFPRPGPGVHPIRGRPGFGVTIDDHSADTRATDGARVAPSGSGVDEMDERLAGYDVPTTQRTLAAVPAEAERPRPRWREAVGAAVLLSVIDTVREQETVASA